jgi:hypothetical protein
LTHGTVLTDKNAHEIAPIPGIMKSTSVALPLCV